MSIDGLGITTASDYEGATQSAQSQSKLDDDMDNFLLMLTTQLKNQDPLSPMDSTEFTNQLVQFSNVEQNIHQNEHLEEMTELFQSNLTAGAVGYIGKTVQMDTSQLSLQNGSATFRYELDETASMCTIAITDSSGSVVRTINADTDAGAYIYSWDGSDQDGNYLEDGGYTISISAYSAENENEQIEADITTFGVIKSVNNVSGEMELGLTGMAVSMDDVIAITETQYQYVEDDSTTEDDSTEEETTES